MSLRLFHGGQPGLVAGDALIPKPNYLDGCPICEKHRNGEQSHIDPMPQEPGHIYATTDRQYARFYASKYPCGDLYTIEPLEDLVSRGDEDPFPSFSCASALVVAVQERFVILTPHERRRLWRKWKVEDHRRGLP